MTTLSYHDKFAMGLRVNPSFEQMHQAAKRPLRIPVPDRSAKWFALSNYRSFMIDQARAYSDYEHLRLDYDQSGAELPASAAMTKDSSSGNDESWSKIAKFNERLVQEHAHNQAMTVIQAHDARVAEELRVQQLSAYAPTLGHWFIEENHEDLEDAGVDHDAPLERPAKIKPVKLPTHVSHPVAAGHLGSLKPFRSFENQNLGQPKKFHMADLTKMGTHESSYDQLRKNAVGR